MTRRKIVLGAAAASVALLVAWFVLLWGPQGNDLDDAREREDVAITANAELALRRDRLVAAKADAPALQAKVEELRLAVPDDANLAQFILDANDAAAASGVDFLSIAPTPPTPGADPLLPQEVNLAITVDGGYFQVLDYMNRLEALPRIVVVDTLSLATTGEDGGPIGLSVSLSARMFTTAPPEPLPGEVPAPGEAPVPANQASTDATTPTTAPEATS